ncbi:hypothetical protein ACFWAX_41675, partial [Streptomyces sp. NPDC059956]
APADSTQEEKDSTNFTKLLIRYYAYGLTQAKATFVVSLAASIVGGAVLITGVMLAIFRADSNGSQYASIVVSVTGLLTAAIGALFHKRADSALRHMEEQTTSLRQDMQAQRDLDQALDLLTNEDNAPVKTHLRAALILKLAGAKLPQLRKVLDDQNAEARAEEPEASSI